MTMTLKPATPTDRERITDAVNLLRNARTMLRLAGATKATEAAQKALNSAEGALRHVDRRLTHTPPPETGPETDTDGHAVHEDGTVTEWDERLRTVGASRVGGS